MANTESESSQRPLQRSTKVADLGQGENAHASPLVSVIIPTKNRGDELRTTVQSVLSQTYDHLEIVVVDDHSTEKVASHLASVNDPRVTVLLNSRSPGAPGARNTGYLASHGEFIAFLDDDDCWDPQKLARQVDYFQQVPQQVGLVYCGFEIRKNDHLLTQIVPRYKGDVRAQILQHNILGSPTPLIRRRCLEQVGLFDERFTSSQDWEMWTRIALRYKFDFLPMILATYRQHTSQISQKLPQILQGRLAFWKKFRGEIHQFGVESGHIRDIAKILRLMQSPSKTYLGLLKWGVITYPWVLQSWLLWLFLTLVPNQVDHLLSPLNYRENVLYLQLHALKHHLSK